MNNPNSKFILPFAFAVVSIISLVMGMRLEESLVRDGIKSESAHDDMSAIYEATEHIRSKYYGDTLANDFTDEVIQEMVDELDPYSHYFSSDQDARYNRYMDGIYSGIGVEFVAYEDTIYIYEVVAGSPASDAGISRGDRLLSTNEVSFTDGYALTDSLSTMIQTSDSLDMTLLSIDKQIKKITVVPSNIDIPLVKAYAIPYQDEVITYVSIQRFYKNVYKDFMTELESHYDNENRKISHLIIDVRDNPGGVVEETMKILNQFFTEKDLNLLSTQSRNSKSQSYKSNGRTFFDVDRVAVLCNENSASASEIVAGVLQDHDKALIIGTHTYGKGLIQQNYDLSNDGSINLSIGEYILPSGRHIYKSKDSTYLSIENERPLPVSTKGIAADVYVPFCKLDSDIYDDYKKKIVQLDAWSITGLRNLHTANPNQQNLQDSCGLIISQKLLWKSMTKATSIADSVSYSDVDFSMKTAIKAITSDNYDMILSGKN